MTDNLTRRGPEDPDKINLNQDWEVRYWEKKFGVSEYLLKKGVERVGPMVKDIKDWLRDNQ